MNNMETYYLVDFENVHNEGVEHISSLSKDDHIHIFYTKNALNISLDIALAKDMDIIGHKVSEGDESLDKHLLSYLGYMLGINKGKDCAYIIIAKDKGYDKIIEFWHQEGFANISRQTCIPKPKTTPQQKIKAPATTTATANTVNAKISAGMSYDLSGEDRTELNIFVQHELLKMKYPSDSANRICKYVIAHCNEERMLNSIHNDLRRDFTDYVDVYEDVKKIHDQFVTKHSKKAKREVQIRSLYGRHFRKKVYVENKEDTIDILLNAETRQAVNNELLKLYGDNALVSAMLKIYQPLIKDLPGR